MRVLVEHVVTRKSQSQRTNFSVRDDFGQWDEKKSSGLFDLLNGKIENGNVRVFPISNWTELDVWSYIEQEQIPSIYFSTSVKYSYVME
jgi:sulfate adenylyltransferase subunit 2